MEIRDSLHYAVKWFFVFFLKIKVVVLLKNGQRNVCPKVGK
jgi:hypothetical protein